MDKDEQTEKHSGNDDSEKTPGRETEQSSAIDNRESESHHEELIHFSSSDVSSGSEVEQTNLGQVISAIYEGGDAFPSIVKANDLLAAEAMESAGNPLFSRIQEQLEGMNSAALEAIKRDLDLGQIGNNLDLFNKTGVEIANKVLGQSELFGAINRRFELPETIVPGISAQEIVRDLGTSALYSPIESHIPMSLPATNLPEPLPRGGTLCALFIVVYGKVEQVAEVLNEEFGRSQRPLCHLVSHETDNCWHIEIFDGDAQEASEIVVSLDNEDIGERLDAWEQWDEKTTRIGYVQISNRPRKPLRFYVFDDDHDETVRTLATRVVEELRQWDIEVEDPGTRAEVDEESLPNPLYTLNNFGHLEVMKTVDELKGLFRSYLQSLGLFAESQTVRDTIRADNSLRIEYLIEGCLVVTMAEVTRPGWTRIHPTIPIWKDDGYRGEKVVEQVSTHLIGLVELIKDQCRWQPVKPASTNLDDWFGYYRECKHAGLKYTLDDVAAELHLSPGYVRNKHSEYKAQYET